MNRRRAAFTMIELLVVIGIIVLLIGLLVPVISRVRTSAATATVTNQMHKISAAIGNYFNDFQAYPGALPNSAFALAGPGPFFTNSANFATYTQSEDLVMALRGGLKWNPNAPTLDLNQNEIDLGPVSFNRAAASPRKNAYIANSPAEFPPVGQSIKGSTNELPGLNYVVDSVAPEFMDTYSVPRPILYLRANGSATAGKIVYNSKIKGAFDATFSYDLAVIQMYLQSSNANGSKDDFHDPTSTAAGDTGFTGANLDPSKMTSKQPPSRAWIVDYFTSPGGTSARGGGYLLLDAGADRVFGTDDDIIVGAGGGQ